MSSTRLPVDPFPFLHASRFTLHASCFMLYPSCFIPHLLPHTHCYHAMHLMRSYPISYLTADTALPRSKVSGVYFSGTCPIFLSCPPKHPSQPFHPRYHIICLLLPSIILAFTRKEKHLLLIGTVIRFMFSPWPLSSHPTSIHIYRINYHTICD